MYIYNEFPSMFTEEGRKIVKKNHSDLIISYHWFMLSKKKQNEQQRGFMLFISGIALEL